VEFVYKAVSTAGKAQRGTIEAESRQAAVLQLQERGLYATYLKEKKSILRKSDDQSEESIWRKDIHFGPKVKSGEFAVFARQLATQIRAGVTIADAVRVLAEQTQNKTFAKALRQVSSELQQGQQLSQAVAERKDIFSNVFINMTRAAEVSGNLDEVMDRMALLFEKEHYTREKVKSAMTYPIFVSVMAVVVTVVLMTKVVPTFVGMFQNFHASLPLPTRIVLAVSNFMVNYWYVLALITTILFLGYLWLVRQEKGRYLKDTILLRMPIFGQLLTKSVISRMARTMGSLFSSAVPVLQSIELTADVIDNAVVSKALRDCRDSLAGGHSLSEPLSKIWVFPPLVIQMIRVGEETGNLDFMLTKIAEFYEAETEATVDKLKSMLEPVLILFLAVIVGVIVLSVISPMFSIYQHVSNMS
jgi:type IV pilus assembly protein PilC